MSDMLKGKLGDPYGGPSIGFKDDHFILYTWGDAPVSMKILVKEKDWDTFLYKVLKKCS